MDKSQKRFVIITQFSYSEPGRSQNWNMHFDVTCAEGDLPARYADWIKGIVKDHDSNERHYGSSRVIAAYEATPISAKLLGGSRDAALKALAAEESAAELAERRNEEAEHALWLEGQADRERAELARLSAKYVST